VKISKPNLTRSRQRNSLTSAAIVSVGALALLVSACTSATQEDLQGSAKAIPKAANAAAAADYQWFAMPDAQYVYPITVPAGVSSVKVSLAGASGWNPSGKFAQGWGAVVDGTLSVHPGDVLTMATGQQGKPMNTNQSPGAGGWAMPGGTFEGGPGGHGHGSQAYDGAGGGGASVLKVNDDVAVVAAAGGGQGGRSDAAGTLYDGWNGGSAGYLIGTNGTGFDPYEAGKGGGAKHPDNDRDGQDRGSGLGGGGGGGGGGYHAGGGGPAGTDPRGYGATGGGGGSSFTSDAVTNVVVHYDNNGYNDTKNGNMGGANLGDGFVRMLWVAAPDITTTYNFQKTDAAVKQSLQSTTPGNTDDGAAVSTGRRTTDSTGTVQANQRWTYHETGGTGTGTLANADSGKCLEINGTSGTLDQWTCQGGDNQLWKIVPNQDGSRLQVTTSWSGTKYLATTVDPEDVKDGTTLTLADTTDNRTTWNATVIN
jgi:hypothetical protein